MIADEAGKQFENSETGKKIQEHKYYDDAKNIGGAAVVAVVSVYDGLTEALAVLLDSTGHATTEVFLFIILDNKKQIWRSSWWIE